MHTRERCGSECAEPSKSFPATRHRYTLQAAALWALAPYTPQPPSPRALRALRAWSSSVSRGVTWGHVGVTCLVEQQHELVVEVVLEAGEVEVV
eukprot:5557861-Prymnesium_polylepis.1